MYATYSHYISDGSKAVRSRILLALMVHKWFNTSSRQDSCYMMRQQTLVGIYLPVIGALNHIPTRSFSSQISKKLEEPQARASFGK